MTVPPLSTQVIRHVLARYPEANNAPDIVTRGQWQEKRAQMQLRLQGLLGTCAEHGSRNPVFHTLEEQETTHYLQTKIAYEVEPGEEVRAYLLMPTSPRRLVGKDGKAAAVLCLHGTSAPGKETVMGAGKPGRDYAPILAEQGFIVLAPDSLAAGERLAPGADPFDTASFYRKHPGWSAAGKSIWDNQCALDILEQLPEVDPARMGCVGHSLGGYGSIWLAAFDERVSATVSSCGLTTWQDNPRRYEFARDYWYQHFATLRTIFDQQEKTGGLLPVDFHEFAALIAPRPFLNISGMTDPTYANNETLPQVGLQLHALWDLLDAPTGFAQLLFGAGHDVPHYSRMLTLGWLQEWLKPEAS